MFDKKIQDEPWYKRNNGDNEMKPYMWATVPARGYPVEVISYPWQEDDGTWMVHVRMVPGDPTTIKTLKAQMVACFPPSSHEWSFRPKKQLGDDPNAFLFDDDGVFGIKENPRTKQDWVDDTFQPIEQAQGRFVRVGGTVFVQSASINRPISHGGEHVRPNGTNR